MARLFEKKAKQGSLDERETAKTREGGVFHGDIAAMLTTVTFRQSREEEQVRNSLR